MCKLMNLEDLRLGEGFGRRLAVASFSTEDTTHLLINKGTYAYTSRM